MRWNSDLAYVIGLITTDGSLSKDGRHIIFTSKDKEQIINFSKILHLNNKIGSKRSSYTNNRKYYNLQFGNVTFYRFLLSIGLFPNKSKTIGSLTIPKIYFADFLRGHLDGDGCTYSYWDKRWKSSFMLYTVFISASKLHLEWIRAKIKELYAIDGYLTFAGKSTFHLNYAKSASMLLLKKIYYKENLVCLNRKRFKIKQSLGIIDKHADVLELVDSHA